MGESKKLFSEFPPPSRQEWEDKITQDLKGAPYKKLITRTPEGIELKPYYHAEDMKGLEYLESLPGSFPYNRSERVQLNDWEIREDIKVTDIKTANNKALDSLNKGATSIAFIIPDELMISQEDFNSLLDGIYFECIHIHFISHNQADKLLRYLKSLSEEKNIDPAKILGSIAADPLGYLSCKGSLPLKFDEEIKKLAGMVKESSQTFTFLKTLSIDTRIIHNSGGSAVQELGSMLSQVSAYIEMLANEGLGIDEIAPSFQLNFATGSSYFMEIAKLRSARLLFANLIRAWEPEKARSERVSVHCSTSEWNQTLYDPYVNMLRGTTENMSAALGGANSISVTTFDKAFRKPTAFSERIARNTQIILKEEAHLNKVVDPAGGSYYIENLTHSLSEEAWKLFLEIEEQGGYYEALKKGFVQQMVKETARQRDMHIATRREILLGTNQYPNASESVINEIDSGIISPPDEENLDAKIEVFHKYRGAYAFEDLRLKVEQSGKKPIVFLLPFGNLTWRKARAGFASSFFACAGYEIIDNPGFETAEEGISKAREAKADIIVLCSSDDEYMDLVVKAKKNNEDNTPLVIAGNPKNAEELTKAGIRNFIHVKSNVLEELKAYNSVLGIR